MRAGKVRYIGASSMFAWQFAKAQHTAERHGWTQLVSMQNHYNLLYREEERLEHLDGAVTSLDMALTDTEIHRLEERYRAHGVKGFG